MTPLARRLRRAHAEARYFAYALRALRRPALGFALCWAVGTCVHHYWGAPAGGTNPSWDEAAYAAYILLMGEVNTALPADPLAQAVLYLLPLLGILLVAEGAIKVGLTVFRKEENAEVWIDMLADSARNHIVLCGLGTVGYRTLEELLAMGEQVFVIEKDEKGEFVPIARERGAHVVIGDARQEQLIRSLNLRHAKAVIIATNDDLANLEIAMEVGEVAPHVNVVMRLFDQRLARRVKTTMNVDVSLSTSAVAAPILATAALDKRVVGAHRVGETLLLVVQLPVPPEHHGQTVGQYVAATSFPVVALNGSPVPLGTSLTPQDVIQVLVPSDRLRDLPVPA